MTTQEMMNHSMLESENDNTEKTGKACGLRFLLHLQTVGVSHPVYLVNNFCISISKQELILIFTQCESVLPHLISGESSSETLLATATPSLKGQIR